MSLLSYMFMDFLLLKRFYHAHSFLESLPEPPGNHIAQGIAFLENLRDEG